MAIIRGFQPFDESSILSTRSNFIHETNLLLIEPLSLNGYIDTLFINY